MGVAQWQSWMYRRRQPAPRRGGRSEQRAPRRRYRPCVEVLEDRYLLSTLQVNNFANGFADAGGLLTFNGTAKVNGTALQLTDGGNSEAGSAFSTNKVNVTHFNTQFSFQLTAGANAADGITFTLQGVGATALGPTGGGLGYGPDHTGGTGGTVVIGSSVAVKFDLYDNQGEGFDSTGLYTDGAAPTNVGSIDLSDTGIDLHSGDTINVSMTYDGTTLMVTETDPTVNQSASQSYTIDIPGTVGGDTAFVGFTGGTGGLTAVQDILTWTYSPTATQFRVTAPASANQGSPFNFTLEALDPFGNVDPTFTGTVQFSSSDPAATLGGQPLGAVFYTFTSGEGLDNGVHTFTGVVLQTPGLQTITATASNSETESQISGTANITVNEVPPQNFSLSLSGSSVQEGQSVTLGGSFTDPGINDTHTVVINWGDGTPATTLSLGVGVFGFSASHAYLNTNPTGSAVAVDPIQVTVTDQTGAATSAGTAIAVVNVPPAVSITTGNNSTVGGLFTTTGFFTDPGEDGWTATVNFGDGTGDQPLALGSDHSFILHHLYGAEGAFTVTVRVTDGQGGVGVATTVAEVFLSGITQVASATAAPGTTVTASVPGITATLTHSADAPGLATILVATVPGSVIDSASAQGGPPGGATNSYDLRALGVTTSDFAVVTFSYTGDGVPTLRYLNRQTGTFQLIQGSRVRPNSFVVDRVHHTITVIFDDTSNPRLTALHGTLITVSVPQTQTVAVPVVAPQTVASNTPANTNTATDAPLAIAPVTTGFSSTSQVSFGLSASQTSLGTADSGGGGEGSEALAAEDAALLRELLKGVGAFWSWFSSLGESTVAPDAAESAPAPAPEPPANAPSTEPEEAGSDVWSQVFAADALAPGAADALPAVTGGVLGADAVDEVLGDPPADATLWAGPDGFDSADADRLTTAERGGAALALGCAALSLAALDVERGTRPRSPTSAGGPGRRLCLRSWFAGRIW